MSKEIELKLAMEDRGEYQKLLRDPQVFDGTYNTYKLEAIYYDTAQFALTRRKVSLRLRKENGQLVATMKYGGGVRDGLHLRREINRRVDDEVMDISHFPEKEKELAMLIGQEALNPIVTTSIIRKLKRVVFGQSLLELALDKGCVMALGQQVPILELELELLEGSPDDLYRFREECLSGYHFHTDNLSKFQKAISLYGDLPETFR